MLPDCTTVARGGSNDQAPKDQGEQGDKGPADQGRGQDKQRPQGQGPRDRPKENGKQRDGSQCSIRETRYQPPDLATL